MRFRKASRSLSGAAVLCLWGRTCPAVRDRASGPVHRDSPGAHGCETTKVNGFRADHIPVLAGALAEQIDLPPDGVMVDATIGHGGHSLLFGEKLGPRGLVIGLDTDEKAVEIARDRLAPLECRVVVVRGNFARIEQVVRERGVEQVDFILADLGVSSSQLADERYGLSFQRDMPLDMRLDQRLPTTAADIVNEADEKSLADLIFEYGQDRASRRIARFIVKHRATGPIETTGQLAGIVCRALGRPVKGHKGRIHPATRTFQALRIAVNNELENLKHLLAQMPGLLRTGGFGAVISYHSLEDGLVKDSFRQNESEHIYRIITRKPIVPDRRELAENRRARSAKLRIAQRV